MRPNGTIVPRNKIWSASRSIAWTSGCSAGFKLGGRAKVDGIVELFNVFNHANYGSYVTTENNAAFGQPVPNVAVEYRRRA